MEFATLVRELFGGVNFRTLFLACWETSQLFSSALLTSFDGLMSSCMEVKQISELLISTLYFNLAPTLRALFNLTIRYAKLVDQCTTYRLAFLLHDINATQFVEFCKSIVILANISLYML